MTSIRILSHKGYSSAPSAAPIFCLLVSLFAYFVSLQEIVHVLLVDLEEGYFDLTVTFEILPLPKAVINLVKNALNYSLVTTLYHHVTSNFGYARFPSRGGNLKSFRALFTLDHRFSLLALARRKTLLISRTANVIAS